MNPTPSQTMIGRRIGRYRILEELGRGGMGLVYRARDETLRRDVALKLLPPHMLEELASHQRSRREALALSRLSHPAVAVIHDYISTPDADCIVMEMVAGESLDRILRRGALREPEAVWLGVQLAQGLAAAHAAGIIHRDLKPNNLRITPDRRLKILDFGLAKRILQSTESQVVETTQSLVVAGTPPYVAPEVWRGELASASSDLYAAGVVLYEMVTGLHPFHDLGNAGIAHAVLNLDPPPPRQRDPLISVDFEAVILRCMEKHPAQRMSAAKELARALEALHARHQRGGGAARRRPKLPGISRRAIGAAAALLLAAGVYAIGGSQGWWNGLGRTPPIRSLAVLPFVNLSGDAGQEYLADGMTDELIAILGEHSSLRVICRTSAMHYKGTRLALPAIARELAVQGVVQGSVQSSGDRMRFSVQLLDARDDHQLWSKQYGGDRRDVLAIQSRVARAIAREIGLRLARGDGARPSPARIDPVAHDFYLQGRFQWNRRNADGVRRAIAYFDSAIGRDSLYAPAHSGLADAWTTAGHLGIFPPADAYPRAKLAALRALALDSTLSEGYVSLANIRQNFDWDWDGAAEDFLRAIELNENNAIAHHWYSNHLAFRGDFDRAMDELRRAQDLDPLSLPIHVGAGACLYFARRYEEALRAYRRAAQIDSTSGLPYRAMAGTYYQLGRRAETAEAIRRWLENQYPPEVSARATVGYRHGGLRGMARVLIGDLTRQRTAGHYEPATHIAELSILDRDRAAALRWLEVAFGEHDTELNRLKVDPLFDPLRGDPRFEALMRKVGLGPPT